jgi:hypothetical protein
MDIITGAIATKAAQKAVEELYKPAEGRIATWWKKHKNKGIARKLGEKVLRIDKIKTLLQAETEVRLTSIYHPSKIIYDQGQPTRVDKLAEFPPSNIT